MMFVRRGTFRVAAATVLVAASLALSVGMQAAQATAVTVSLDPTSGPPGQAVNVHGLHWVANAEIDVLFVQNGTTRFLGSTTSNANGYFQITVTIPNFAAQGSAIIRVQQPISQIRKSPTFTVT